MSALSEHLEAAATIGQVADALRSEWETERVSIARFDHGHATFEIVGWSGKPLFSPGLEVPVDLSTQMLASAHGETYVAARFADDPVWHRPIDEFMLGIGFGCGCTMALGAPEHPVGAVSLTSTAPRRTFDRSLDSLAGVRDLLTDRLLAVCEPATVLVCHDEPIVAEGLIHVIERDAGMRGVTFATLEAAARAAQTTPFACVVAGAYVDGRPAGALWTELRRAGIGAPLVVVARHDTVRDRRVALASGAAGFAVLDGEGPGIADVVEQVRAGRAVPAPAPGLAADWATHLTRRESDVLLDLDDGLRFKEIALRRGISEATAKSYARSLFRKLDVHSRTEAVNEAREQGLLESLRQRFEKNH